MGLLLIIAAAAFVLFGIGLFFADGIGPKIGGAVCLLSGMYAYDTSSFLPLVFAFVVLWVLRILGFERR